MEKEDILKQEIIKSRNLFLKLENELLSYNIYVHLLNSFEFFINDANILELALKETKSNIELYEKVKLKLSQGNKSLNSVTDEMTYRTYYQYFEEFLFNMFFSIYKAYPKYLKKEKENFTLSYENIFETNDIVQLQKIIIEKRIKEIIQSNNINSLLKKFKTYFGVEINISESERKLIIETSLNRNILTHNSGIVNNIYLEECKKNKIETEYKELDQINVNRHLKELRNQLDSIVEKIFESINSKSKQIDKYYENIC